MAGSSASAVRQKQLDLSTQYKSHREDVSQLQSKAIEDLLPSLSEQENWEEDAQERAKKFLEDEATIFRFLRRSRFDQDAAVALLTATLKWRVRTDIDMLSLSSLHPLYTSPPQDRPPLFWLGSDFTDRFGRPCGLISLQSLERTQDRTLDECKEYIVACMEIVRRRIVELRRKFQASGGSSSLSDEETTRASEGPLQLVIAFDLISSSMSNLELELLPFLLDLLKNHFPGMVGAVFVLHYGWVHAGMWGLAKRILPAAALAKIFFPNDAEFTEFFHPSKIPTELGVGGGEWQVSITESSNNVMARLGRPDLQPGRAGGSAPSSPTGTATNSPALSRKGHISRSGSFESLADTYFSAAGTPRAGHSRIMTPRDSGRSTPRGSATAGSMTSGLEMTPSAAKKLRTLSMTRGYSDTNTITQRRQRADSLKARQQQQQHQLQLQLQQQEAESSSSAVASLPIKRNRSLRDFRLLEDLSATNYPDEDESDADSDKSGKTGETSVGVAAGSNAARTGRSAGRLGGLLSLSRWKGSKERSGSAEEERKYRQELSAQQSAQQRQSVAQDHIGSEEETSIPAASSSSGDHSSNSRLLSAPSKVDPSNPPRFLSRRSRKLDKIPGAVSPYNKSNPFWGYPAWIVQQSSEEDDEANESTVQGGHRTTRSYQMTVERRWRDLFRTLSYLFVLRIFSAHRNLRWKFQRLLTYLQSIFTKGNTTSVHYNQRSEQYRKLKSVSTKYQHPSKMKKGTATSVTTHFWNTNNVLLATFIFAIAMIVRLKTHRGFIRDLGQEMMKMVHYTFHSSKKSSGFRSVQ
ncbi:unnamed protein product [Sympodiomycopsis kandeliae]